MRLLNARSKKLKYFQGERPPYVILSHTWGHEEVTYRDISGTWSLDHLQGYQKINGCCKQGISDGYEWVWVDTCCIDKTSSAELSEAINSMFQWYKDADICYAYLGDISNRRDLLWNNNPQAAHSSWRHMEVANSRWFTRGWTLQELIAPSEIVFYDSGWVEIGTKSSLSETLSRVTGIDIQLFVDANCDDYSIAQRMSWASKRNTTRLEDEAYCLMGIFGVNMPLLYGEGRKAFFRLQEEIMKRSDDHSLFAWSTGRNIWTGLLAPSPREFLEAGNIKRLPAGESSILPYSITNKGVQITLPLIVNSNPYNSIRLAWTKLEAKQVSAFECRTTKNEVQSTPLNIKPEMRIALLNCKTSDTPGQPIGIVLGKVDNMGYYLRTHHHVQFICPLNLSESGMKTQTETIFIGLLDRAHPSLDPSKSLREDQRGDKWCCMIRTLPSPTHGFFLLEQYPRQVWTSTISTLRVDIGDTSAEFSVLRLDLQDGSDPAALLFADSGVYRFAVLLQRRRNHRVYAGVEWCWEDESAEATVARCKGNLNPQDRITYKLSQEKMVSVNIRRSPSAHLVDISIRSNRLSIEL